MVSETEIDELEAEIVEKRERLKEKRLDERHGEAKSELREIRDEADDRIEEIADAEREAEEREAVRKDKAYFCRDCGGFVEYETIVGSRRKNHDWYDAVLCPSCYRSQRREKHAEELAAELVEPLTITNYRIDTYHTDKVRERGGVGALDISMDIETADGRKLRLEQDYDNSYHIVKEIETEGDDE